MRICRYVARGSSFRVQKSLLLSLFRNVAIVGKLLAVCSGARDEQQGMLSTLKGVMNQPRT
jgi:hypothetical protein